MKENIKNLVPMGLLSAFVIKLLACGTNACEMGVVFSLSAVVYGYEYLSKRRKIESIESDAKKLQEELITQAKDNTTTIAKQNDVIKAMAIEIDGLRNNMTSVKMAAGISNSVIKKVAP